jgi:hypothetical protein
MFFSNKLSIFLFLSTFIIKTTSQSNSCCVYNGNGFATLFANSVITLPDINGQSGTGASLVTSSLGSGTATNGDTFISVIIGSTESVEESIAGWIITSNSTGQILTLWYNTNQNGRTPICSRTSAAFPETFVPSTNLCCGKDGSTFSDYISSYMQGSTKVSWFGMNKTTSSMIAVTTDSCVPVTVLAPSSPLGGGAFSFAIQGGSPQAAPSSWADAPIVCGY